MAGFDTNLNYGAFDPDMDPTSVGSRFRKYVERFKVYALAMNIKDKARKRALFLHCAGPKVQDMFDTLEDTIQLPLRNSWDILNPENITYSTYTSFGS